MIDPLSALPSWLFVLALPVAAFLLVIVWLLTRGSHSVIKLSGFGVTVELKDATAPINQQAQKAVERTPYDLAD